MEKIPDGWTEEPIKYADLFVSDLLPESTKPDYSFRYVDIGSVTSERGIGRYTDMEFAVSPSRARKQVEVGDTIVSSVRTYLKAIAMVTEAKDVIVSTGFSVIRPVEHDPKYLYYLCSSDLFCQQVNKYSWGIAYPAISETLMGGIRVPMPPVAEQCAIAAVLDSKCGVIDRTMSTLEKQISTLERYRASVIHEAVTRGLDPTKPSGVEWIGDIPESRKLPRLKDVLHINNGKEVANDDGDIPVYGSGGQFKWTDRALCSTPALLLGRKGTVNKPLLVKEPFWTVDTMFYGTQKMESDLRFLFYCALCFDFDCYQTGSTLPSMTQTDLGGILLPFPSIDEQCSIADYLDRRTSAIDAVLDTKRKQLDVLKRRRQSLIYEYVTGKRRVTEEA